MPLVLNAAFTAANTATDNLVARGAVLSPSEDIYRELYALYGSEADNIVFSNLISVVAPSIAENGAEVDIRIEGKKGLVESLAVFAVKNVEPLIAVVNFSTGANLAVRLRSRIFKTSNVIAIAKTNEGLIAAQQEVKVTIGCGGGM